MRKLLLVPVCLALVGGLYVIGQDRETPREGKATHRSHRATGLLGATVTVKGGDSLGKIQDMVIDDRGIIEYLIVQMDQGMVPVPWGAVNLGGDRTITLTVEFPRDRMKEIIFTEKNWPDFYSDQWLRTATNVWGERVLHRDFRPEPRRDDVRRDDVRKDDVRKDDTRRDDVRKDVPLKDAPIKDAPAKDVPRKDDLRKDAPVKDVPAKDVPRKDDLRKDDRLPPKDVPLKDAKDAPVKDRRPDLPPDRRPPIDRPPTDRPPERPPQ